jgi:hypothetical protein
MIGSSVRSLYVKGKGFPCFVSVEQDGTGKALSSALALSLAIGATKAGAIASSAREETMMDLFAGKVKRKEYQDLKYLKQHRTSTVAKHHHVVQVSSDVRYAGWDRL